MSYVTTIGMKKWFICKCGNGYMQTKSRSSGFRSSCEVCSELPIDYRKEVRALSLAYRRFIPHIEKVTDSNGKMLDGWSVDHIVPVWSGEYLGISIYEMAGVENLQVISFADNDVCCKYGKGLLLPEKWFALITGKKWIYTIEGSYFESHSLLEACQYAGISYVKAASQLMQNCAERILVGGLAINRV